MKEGNSVPFAAAVVGRAANKIEEKESQRGRGEVRKRGRENEGRGEEEERGRRKRQRGERQ